MYNYYHKPENSWTNTKEDNSKLIGTCTKHGVVHSMDNLMNLIRKFLSLKKGNS